MVSFFITKALSRVLRYSLPRSNPGPINFLLVLALVSDLLTPFLIWKGILPEATRWLSHASLGVMMVGAYTRMMIFDWIPRVVWVIVGVSTIWSSIAFLQGQSIVATAWGWWIMFQFPLVGLYAYLQPYWPDRFSQRLRTFCAALLGMQVTVQIGQYLTGEPPGDNLAGMFGWSGTANLMIFILLVLCLALGQWLVYRQLATLVWVLILGSISSVLGEMKLFPFAALALGMLAIILFVFRGGQLWKLVPYTVLVGIVTYMFFGFYDTIVSVASRKPLEQFLEPQTLTSYLYYKDQEVVNGSYVYDVGRNYLIDYGWNTINEDITTLLFGFGLGARSESRSLGIVGIGLQQGDLGLYIGTSLLVMMQELGLVGLVILGGFICWVAMALFKGIRSNPQSDVTELRYALLLFSLLWPLWLWYTTVWNSRVPMLLYWAALGYALRTLEGHQTTANKYT